MLLATSASGGILVTSATGTPYQFTSVSDFVGGGQMAGLSVTVVYDNGDMETRTWVDMAGGLEGGINRSFSTLDWKIEAITSATSGTFGDQDENNSDDGILETVGEFWEFEVKPEAFTGGRNHVAKLILDGVQAGIVFDRPVLDGSLIGTPYHPVETTPDNGFSDEHPERNQEGADLLDLFVSQASGEGTAGSWRGRDFYATDFDNSTEDDLLASYLNQAGTFGDLYTRLEISFLDGFGATSFTFGLDTDRVTGLQAIPEPSSLIVLLMSLSGAAAARRRSNK